MAAYLYEILCRLPHIKNGASKSINHHTSSKAFTSLDQLNSKNIILMAATADKSKPYIPLAGVAEDGWSKEDEATATCFCGAVQLAFVS